MTTHLSTQHVVLGSDELEDVKEADEALRRLAARRRSEVTVAGPLAQSKQAWKVAVYQQSILYRVVMLAEGAVSTWNDGNILTSILAARALIETVAVVYEFTHQLKAYISASDLVGLSKFTTSMIFATRDEKFLAEHSDLRSRSVLTYIDKLDAGGLKGVRKHYDSMSERCQIVSRGVV
jgi:hypothetical protein